MKTLATILVLFAIVGMLQATPNLKAVHQSLTNYYGDREALQNAEHSYVSQDGQLYSVFYSQKTMSFYTEMANGQKFYVVANFDKATEEQLVIDYRFNVNNGQRAAAFNFKVEYQLSEMSRSIKVIPSEDTRGWNKACWQCLLGCLGSGTSCGACIAAPTCWGTWGAGCLLCIPPCAGAISQCMNCTVCF